MTKKKDLAKKLEPFLLSEEESPRTAGLYAKFPQEIKEFWVNVQADRELNKGVETDLEDFLQPALVSKAKECFIADGLAEEDASRKCGLRPLVGYLRGDNFSILERMRFGLEGVKYQIKKAEKSGVDGFHGGEYTTKIIPRKLADKIKGCALESVQMARNAYENEATEEDDLCILRMSVFIQIDDDEIEEK